MMSVEQLFEKEIDEHFRVSEQVLLSLKDEMSAMVECCKEAIRNGRKLLFFGNGGSAADAQHLAAELVIRYKDDRKAIPAIALTTDSSILTAGGNDMGFDNIFLRQIEALGQNGDVAVAISTSGNSQNVNLAVTNCLLLGVKTVGLTGRGGGKLADLCDISICVPSATTARIQEMHIMLGHIFCAGLERELGYL